MRRVVTIAALSLIGSLVAPQASASEPEPHSSAVPAASAAPLTLDSPAAPHAEPEQRPDHRSVRTARSEADGLYVEFGQGVTLTSEDSAFRLTLRGRLQARATAMASDLSPEPLDVFFAARRARLVFLGNLGERGIEFYIQLGLSPDDMEPDRLVPLRDAVILWTRHRDFSVRFGQMKVNFSRERMISSSALQLVDRSIVNAELSLDRDIGVQIFSNDMFGWGERIAWQLGVYGGDGRNRARPGAGLLYAARLQFNPFGHFDDLFFEADLSRSRMLRMSLGLAGGLNYDTVRARSTHGPVLTAASDTRHGAVDLLLKVSGFSLQAEALIRRAVARELLTDPSFGVPSARGAFVQSGYVFAQGIELSGRWAAVQPLPPPEDSSGPRGGGRTELATAIGWYMQRHELKLQADYTHGIGNLYGPPVHEQPRDHAVRIQAQVFF